MAVAFDAASNSGALTSVSTANWSHTCSGSDRALFVGTGSSSGSGGAATTSITYNSVGMTELWDVVSQQGVLANSGYILAAPATGANTVAVTWAATADELAAGAMSFTGVDQSTPNDTAPTPATSAGAATVTITVSSAVDDMVVDNAYIGAATAITVGAGQDSRWELEDIGGFAASGGSNEAGAASVTMTWTLAGGSLPWVTGAVNLNASAGGGAVYVLPLILQRTNTLLRM